MVPILDSRVNQDVPKELIPKHLQVSDCIVLSAPINSELPGWSHYDGFEILMMRVSQLTHRFLEAGYLLQGGIDIGFVWHGDNNIVGPAYQAAATLEKEGINPCILVSESGRKRLSIRKPHSTRIAIDFDGCYIVNGLHAAYIQSESLAEEDVYSNYRVIVSQNINRLSGSAKAKWEWFQSYLEREIATTHPWIKNT